MEKTNFKKPRVKLKCCRFNVKFEIESSLFHAGKYNNKKSRASRRMWRCVSMRVSILKGCTFVNPNNIITDKVPMLSVHESTSQHVHSVKLLLLI
jgi:hypothetical protein